ncbi:MAG: WD40 repeat domain-containing protein [Actinomycetota bacterium]
MKRVAQLFPWLGLTIAAWAGAAERPAPVTALQFTPDGSALVSGGYRSISIHGSTTAAPIRSIACDLSRVQSLQFSPDGKTLAVSGGGAGESGAAVLLDWPAGKVRRTLTGHADLVTSVAFSPDGGRIATASADATVRIWATGGPSTPELTLQGHAGPVLAVAFSPDGSLLVTASADRSLKVWDARTGGLQRSLTNHTDIVHTVSFRPLSSENQIPHPYCVSASDDRTVRVWQPGIGRMVRIIRGHAGPALTALYSRDGARIYSVGTEGVVRAIDAESDEVLQSWKAAPGWVYSLALSPDGGSLATGDWQGLVRRWNLRKSPPEELGKTAK